MRRSLLIIFLTCSFLASFCQTQEWKQVRIDSFVSISLPVNFTSFDTAMVKKGREFNTRVFKASTDLSHLGITVTRTNLNINPYDHDDGVMMEAYRGIKYGFVKNAESQGFSVELKDTFVNNVKGFIGSVYTDKSRQILSRLTCLFCVNTLTYSIIIAPAENNGPESRKDMMRMLESIQFNKEEILRTVPAAGSLSTSFKQGERIGKLLAPVLLVAGIVIFIVYKSKKKRQS